MISLDVKKILETPHKAKRHGQDPRNLSSAGNAELLIRRIPKSAGTREFGADINGRGFRSHRITSFCRVLRHSRATTDKKVAARLSYHGRALATGV